MKHPTLFLAVGVLALGACSQIPPVNYSNRGTPESLMDVAVEQVTVPIDGAAGIDDLIGVLNQRQPTSATLQCATDDMLCKNARRVLQQFAVPSTEVSSAGGNQVVLVYEQLMARDCDPSYVDNTINPYNLSHPSFGCANAANMMMMVSDKRQFTNPALLGYSDGTKSRQVYLDYIAPSSEQDESQDDKSLLDKVKSE